jgi:hypothetical protein
MIAREMPHMIYVEETSCKPKIQRTNGENEKAGVEGVRIGGGN